MKTYNTPVGKNIESAAVEAIQQAVDNQEAITLIFNALSIKVTEDMTPDNVVEAYYKAMDDRSDDGSAAYKKSPEYKAREKAKMERAVALTRNLAELSANEDTILKQGSTSDILHHIAKLSEIVDQLWKTYDGNKAIADILNTRGYYANAYTGDKFIEGNKEVMGRYIIGQALNDLEKGRNPIDHVLQSFVERYDAMPDTPAAIVKKITAKPHKPGL